MENYVRVRQPRPEEDTEETDVQITAAGRARGYIQLAADLFNEKGHKKVTLKAMGKTINKTVAIAEILKRRIAGLHQNITIHSKEIIDVWEPKEGADGLDSIETVRQASVMVITLSKEPLDTESAGYQAPLPESEVQPLEDELTIAGEADGEGGEHRQRRSGGRGRGRHGGGRNKPRAVDGDGEGDEGAERLKEKRTRRPRGRRGRNGPDGEHDGLQAADRAATSAQGENA